MPEMGMSSEKSTKPGHYAQYYLAPQPQISDSAWLMTLIQADPDWRVLDITGRAIAILAPHAQQVVNGAELCMDMAAIPFPDVQFDLIVYQHQAITRPADDLFDVMREAARVLKPTGQLVVQDLGLPDDERAAQYVNAIYRFRDSGQRRSLAPYKWQGMMLDAGLQVAQTEVMSQPKRVTTWAADCTPYVMERMHILLHQAPAAVADYLRPFATGTADAMFTQTLFTLVGQKPLA